MQRANLPLYHLNLRQFDQHSAASKAVTGLPVPDYCCSPGLSGMYFAASAASLHHTEALCGSGERVLLSVNDLLFVV